VGPVSPTVGVVMAALAIERTERASGQVTEAGLAAIGKLVEQVHGHFREHGNVASSGR
jgi:hypothetical protein